MPSSDDGLAAHLPPGIDPKTFAAAVAGSGYPLQMYAAARLRDQQFAVEEEWAFTDPEGDKRRAIDVFARKVGPEHTSKRGTTRLALELLIECKQSRHPFVFFRAVDVPAQDDHPSPLFRHREVVVGPRFESPPNLEHNWVVTVPLGRLLGIDTLPFIRDTPVAASMSIARANGKKIEMSGDEGYRELLLPLTKAGAAHRASSRPRSDDDYQVVRLPMLIALLDAPIFLVDAPDINPVPVDRIRLFVRPSVNNDSDRVRRASLDFVEIVSRQAFTTFLTEELAAFAQVYDERIAAHHTLVLSGRGEIAGLRRDDLTDLSGRLDPG